MTTPVGETRARATPHPPLYAPRNLPPAAHLMHFASKSAPSSGISSKCPTRSVRASLHSSPGTLALSTFFSHRNSPEHVPAVHHGGSGCLGKTPLRRVKREERGRWVVDGDAMVNESVVGRKVAGAGVGMPKELAACCSRSRASWRGTALITVCRSGCHLRIAPGSRRRLS